jgi:hypothetical protein
MNSIGCRVSRTFCRKSRIGCIMSRTGRKRSKMDEQDKLQVE